jgi:hypothetical protein
MWKICCDPLKDRCQEALERNLGRCARRVQCCAPIGIGTLKLGWDAVTVGAAASDMLSGGVAPQDSDTEAGSRT